MGVLLCAVSSFKQDYDLFELISRVEGPRPRLLSSVKPFESKNLDNVALDGSNPNLKKVHDRDSHATT